MEKRILFLFILLLVGLGFSPLSLKAQLVNNGAQVTLVNNGILYVDGDLINQRSVSGIPNFSACLGPKIIVTGSIINNSGTEFFFAGDSSLVIMKGSSLQLIQGTDSINFFRLQISNTSDSVKLERSISVIDLLMMQSGYVNLNGQDINLNTTGYLTGETASTFIFGDSGNIFLQRPIFMNASPENIGGLGAAIQSNSNLGFTTITRSHQAQNVANVTSGFRYYEINPSFAVSDQTFVFNYFDHELNGVAENDLQLYHSLDNGQSWSIQNAFQNTALNTLIDSTSQFSGRYTMADDVCKLNPVVVDLGNDTALCSGDSITLNALNPGSDFIWSSNETSQSIKVVAGSYGVTVISANGCIGADTILVNQNPQPIVQTSNDTVICTGQPLTIGDLNLQLPNTNSYLWNTAATTQSILVNTATARIDTFIYTITTPEGCSIVDSIRVEIINQPVVDLGNDTALCQTEMLTLNATNTGATYLWSTGATTPSIQVNSTSTYSVTVTNGICQAIDTIEMIKSNLISSIQKTDINCYGNSNGTAEVTGLNGITPYSYVWNTSTSSATIATTKAITNLAAGKYYATITDSIGCSIVSDTVEIFEPTEITLSFVVSNESCTTGNDGAIDLTVTGGTGTLSFNWSTSTSSARISTSEDLINMTAGKYIVTVTDVNSCTQVDSVSIIRPSGFTTTKNFTNISCNGANDATVNYSLSGGSAPFIFTYSNGLADSVQSNLSAGTYSVLIQDANNCSYRDTVTVINPSAISSSLVGTNLTCFNNGSAAINLTPSGGTGVLTFNWSTSTSSATISTSEDLTNLTAGKYKLTITDENG
ncbi:MAG: SprB repeat-containing protein, partial [Flavobacteriales bacterium]|nr:SprB repeat-containing protein [Flavobacteriales bacterium]